MEVTRIADLPPELYEMAQYNGIETLLCERVHKDTEGLSERKWGRHRVQGRHAADDYY